MSLIEQSIILDEDERRFGHLESLESLETFNIADLIPSPYSKPDSEPDSSLYINWHLILIIIIIVYLVYY